MQLELNCPFGSSSSFISRRGGGGRRLAGSDVRPRTDRTRTPIAQGRAGAISTSLLSTLRTVRRIVENQGGFFHTARCARPRGRSHNTHFVSTHVLSSPRGIGILAQSPRRDQRAGGRRTRRTPPTHTANTQGSNAARLQRRKSRSSSLSELSQQPLGAGRAGGQPMGGCRAPTFGQRGPNHPTGGRRPRPPLGRSPPLRRAALAAVRSDSTARADDTAFPTANNACMRGKRPASAIPSPGGETHAPPIRAPVPAL